VTSRSPVVDNLLALRDDRDAAAREMSFVSDANVETRISYGELAELAIARAAALRALDLRPGELVMLSYPASIDWISLFLGCVLAGVVPCTMPMPGKRLVDTTSHVIDVAAGLYRPRAIFAGDDLLDALRAMPAARAARLIGQTEVARASAAGAPPLVHRAASDPHHVQLTSGSVAHPKAAVISHASVWANVQGVLGALGSDPALDSTVLWLPTHHDMGLITLLTNLHFKSTQQLLQPSSFVRNPLGWLKRIATRRATVTVAPTFALRYCLRRFNADRMAGSDLGSLRNFVIGAEHVDPETVDEFARTFAPYGFDSAALQPCYGMAETTLASTMQRVGTDRVRRPAMAFVRADRLPTDRDGKLRLSVGVPIAGMAVEIRDPGGAVVGDRAPGEIMLRGSSVMSGYLAMAGQPALASPIRADGWLATGDIGYLADGELFILGRMKEIIIIRGCNYFPDEIEAAVADHAVISKDGCAAIGVHDAAQGTEQLVLMIEAEPERVTAQARGELQAMLLQRIGFAAHELVFVSPGALPRTTSGKLQRLKCRSMFVDGTAPPSGGADGRGQAPTVEPHREARV
jgi:fatty-acyl-CoA synthase